MTPKGLQEVNGRGQTAETIFADGAPKQPEKPDRLISLRCRLGDSFWNCLEDSLEPFRLDAPENAAPKKEIPDSPATCLAWTRDRWRAVEQVGAENAIECLHLRGRRLR